MNNRIDSLTHHRINEIATTIEDYFKTIDFQRLEEIDFLANQILSDFKNYRVSDKTSFELKFQLLMLKFPYSYSSKVQSSLHETFDLIGATVDFEDKFVGDEDRDQWGEFNIKLGQDLYLRQQIVGKINHFAHWIKGWSEETKLEHLEQVFHNPEKIREKRSSLKLKLEDLKVKSPKPRPIYSLRKRTFIDEIKKEVKANQLQKLVNTKVTLRENIPLLREIISQNSYFFRQFSDFLGKNRELSFAAIELNGKNFMAISSDFKNDFELASLAVKKDPSNYFAVSQRVKNDLQFCLQFVMNCPRNLTFMTPKEPYYNQLATTCWNLDKENLRYVKPHTSIYRKLALATVKKEGLFLRELVSLQDDEEIVLAAVKSDADVYSMTDSMIRENKKIALEACAKKGGNLEHVAVNLRGDREVVAAALKNDFSAMRFASPIIQKDWTFFPLQRLIHYLQSSRIYRFFSKLFK